MPPLRKSGGNFFERRFLCFHKDSWISFQSDVWTLILAFQRDMDTVFRTLDILDLVLHGYGYGSVFRILDSFGFTQRYGLVFRTSGRFGLVFLLDFGLN